jgi:hypothetical protein
MCLMRRLTGVEIDVVTSCGPVRVTLWRERVPPSTPDLIWTCTHCGRVRSKFVGIAPTTMLACRCGDNSQTGICLMGDVVLEDEELCRV